jgi:hypothetical protein
MEREIRKVIELIDHRISPALITLTQKVDNIMAALDALKAEVARNKSVQEAAATLLAGLKARLDDALANGPDEGALKSLSNDLGGQTDALAAAVAANTVADSNATDPAPAEPVVVE